MSYEWGKPHAHCIWDPWPWPGSPHIQDHWLHLGLWYLYRGWNPCPPSPSPGTRLLLLRKRSALANWHHGTSEGNLGHEQIPMTPEFGSEMGMWPSWSNWVNPEKSADATRKRRLSLWGYCVGKMASPPSEGRGKEQYCEAGRNTIVPGPSPTWDPPHPRDFLAWAHTSSFRFHLLELSLL